MENRDHRESKELASATEDLHDHGSSRRRARSRQPWRSDAGRGELTTETSGQQPVISIQLENDKTVFSPADFLSGEFCVRLLPDQELQALEYSVIWITSGKGEEDIGVHFFQRRNRNAFQSEALSQPQRFSTVLPSSPLSYDGRILKIRWACRVRIFLADGQEIIEDLGFKLGNCGLIEKEEPESEPDCAEHLQDVEQ